MWWKREWQGSSCLPTSLPLWTRHLAGAKAAHVLYAPFINAMDRYVDRTLRSTVAAEVAKLKKQSTENTESKSRHSKIWGEFWRWQKSLSTALESWKMELVTYSALGAAGSLHIRDRRSVSWDVGAHWKLQLGVAGIPGVRAHKLEAP